MTRRSNRTSLARKRWRELEYLLYFSAGPEPVDASSVWADSRAHRATHVASDLIERPAHGGSETRGGAIPAGVSLRAVLRGHLGGGARSNAEKDSCHRFRVGGTAGWRACGLLSGGETAPYRESREEGEGQNNPEKKKNSALRPH